MAPNRGSTRNLKSPKGKTSTTRPKPDSKIRVSKTKSKAPPPRQQKTKRPELGPKKQKRREYTAEELGVPKLNMITPAGVRKPRGKKKGKVFVEDPESVMTILAIVNAEKEGQIESKMVKARQLEEIREARRKEQERKEQAKKDQLEEVKDGLRRKRVKNSKIPVDVGNDGPSDLPKARKSKKVSFG